MIHNANRIRPVFLLILFPFFILCIFSCGGECGQIHILASKTEGRIPLKINFQVEDYDITSYSWDFIAGDGVSEDTTSDNPTYVFSNPGTYEVKLTAQIGASVVTSSINITATPVTYTTTSEGYIELIDLTGTEENPIIIEGYELTEGNQDNYAIFVNNCEHLIIHGCYIHDLNGYGRAMRIENSSKLKIEGNIVLNNEMGIEFINCTEIEFCDNVIENTHKSIGVAFRTSNYCNIHDNFLKDNGDLQYFESQRIIGIILHKSNHGEIYNNVIYRSSSDGIGINCIDMGETAFSSYVEDFKIYNNTSIGNNEQGIWLIGVTFAEIYNNFIEKNISQNTCSNGIFLEWGVKDSHIHDNVIKNNQAAGINIEESNNVLIEANEIENNDIWGIYIVDDPGTWITGTPVVETKSNTINSNIVKNNPCGIEIEDCSYSPYNVVSCNTIQNNHIGLLITNSIINRNGNIFSGNGQDFVEE